MIFVNQLASTSGPPVDWIENDPDRALSLASTEKPRIFLYLYEPDDPTHARNEREIFTQRWARSPLANAICCRVALRDDDVESLRLRRKYGYRNTPLFLLLDRQGKPVTRAQGALTQKEFYTYIGQPLGRLGSTAEDDPPEPE
jgi:hypothetical protein